MFSGPKFIDIDNEAYNFATGYIEQDYGDELVKLLIYLTENNAYNFVTAVKPEIQKEK